MHFDSNIKTLGWDQTSLGKVTDAVLYPAAYLLKGKRVTSLNPYILQAVHSDKKFLKIAAFIFLFIPSLIFGYALRIISHIHDATRRCYQALKTAELKDIRSKEGELLDPDNPLFMHKISEAKAGQSGVYVISYSDGKPLYFYNQKSFLESAKKYAKEEVNYFVEGNKTNLSSAFLKEQEEVLKQPQGAGYWVWKPYMILKMMQEAPEDAVILYADGGSIELKKSLGGLIKQIQETGRVFFENWHTTFPFTKRDCFVKMGCDHTYHDVKQLDASVIGLKNTAENRRFVREWLTYCSDKQLITDAPSKNKEIGGFKEHRNDQAILSLLLFRKMREEGFKATILPEKTEFNHHRRREIPASG